MHKSRSDVVDAVMFNATLDALKGGVSLVFEYEDELCYVSNDNIVEANIEKREIDFAVVLFNGAMTEINGKIRVFNFKGYKTEEGEE